MKKYIILILSLFIPLIFINTVNASTNTYPRNKDNNYGINKKVNITDNVINNALKTPYVDATEKIYDFSDVLSDEEEKKLYDIMVEYEKSTGMDIVFVSDSFYYTYDDENETYAANFYDYNDFALNIDNYSGSLLLLNTYEGAPYFEFYTFGECQLYFNDSRYNIVLDAIYPLFKAKDYYGGIRVYVNQLKFYYSNGVVNKNERIDSNGFIYEKDSIPFLSILSVAIPGSVIITLIIMLILISRNKMIKKAYMASEYLVNSSVNFTDKRDVFVSSRTTSHTNSSSSSSSSGHSSSSSRSRSGSSGRGHSRSGGRRL